MHYNFRSEKVIVLTSSQISLATYLLLKISAVVVYVPLVAWLIEARPNISWRCSKMSWSFSGMEISRSMDRSAQVDPPLSQSLRFRPSDL